MKPGLFPNELRIVCTDRGEHAPIELALLMVHGDREPGLPPGEPSRWRLPGEGGRLPGEPERFKGEPATRFSVAQGVRTRRTRAGVEKPNEAKSEVVKRTRADGGVTFEFPACPTCKGQTRIIHDDKLAAFMRGAPGQNLDVSLLRWHNGT